MITLTINGRKYEAQKGQNLLQAALDNGIEIPHLCYHEKLPPYGGCRLCQVEVTKGKKVELTTSCTYPVSQGIQIETETPRVQKARRLVMELILTMAPDSPEIQQMARKLGIETIPGEFPPGEKGDSCIKCGLCVRACEELVGPGSITFSSKGPERKVVPPFEEEPESCIGCGTCVHVCPTGCISMEDLGRKRKLERWKRVLSMKVCNDCSSAYIPKAQVDYYQKRTGDPSLAEWFDLCPDCR